MLPLLTIDKTRRFGLSLLLSCLLLLLVDMRAESAHYKLQMRDKRSGDGEPQFNYANPADWGGEFPACNGPKQSPINIELQDVKVPEGSLPPIGRSGYDTLPEKLTIVNNGHSTQLTGVWPAGETPTINGGPLTDVYEFIQLHFHWSPDNSAGSEHTVAGHSFPIELHIVHWKLEYGSFEEAVKHDDGLAVVGALFSVSNNANPGIAKIQEVFSNIQNPDETTEIEPFPLSLFDLDLAKDGYLTYLGSLSTPPCFESVVWLLSVRIKDITNEQLDTYRKLQLNNDDDHNYRPIQPLNDRPISYIYG